MLRYIYERLLEAQISRRAVPGCVAVVLSAGDLDPQGLKRVRDLIGWSNSIGIPSLLVYIGGGAPHLYQSMVSQLSGAQAEISLHTEQGAISLGTGGGISVVISLGFGGRREVAEAIRRLLMDVEIGLIKPEEIDEEMIEANLRFSQKPDLVIRAGGKQLSDFMIWQSAYSELYFTEVNWNSLRRIDFLRAIRDYQQRERRFGR